MLPYFIVYTTIIGFSYISNNRNKDILFACASILLFLFAALRGNGDGDYFVYKNWYSLFTNLDKVLNSNFPMEIGYRFLSYILNLLHLDSQFIIISMSLLSVGLISLFIHKTSRLPLISLIIYFGFYMSLDMHHARQGIATAFICFAYQFYYQKKFFLCGVFLIFGHCFHKSSVIVLAFFIVYQLLFRKKGIKTNFGVLLILITLLIAKTIGFDSLIFSILDVLQFDYLSIKFNIYMNSDEYGYPFSLLDPRLLLLLLCYLLFSLGIKKITHSVGKKEMIFYRDVVLVAALALIVLSEHTLLALRISYYFSILCVVSIPNFCYYLSKERLLKKSGQVPWYAFSDWALIGGYILLNLALILTVSESAPYQLYSW